MIASHPQTCPCCVCPLCEGRGKTARLVRSDAPSVNSIFGWPVPVAGYLMDRPCSRCGGSGRQAPVPLPLPAEKTA